jgi:quercetin 2,3-dioxygenase
VAAPRRARHRGRIALPGQPQAVLHVLHGPDRLPAAPFVYVHTVRGELRLGGGHILGPGDAARITGEADLSAETGGGDSEYLVWEMHAEPSYG